MRYEDVIRRVCSEEWKINSQEEAGGYGVACLKAFLQGVKPTVGDIASHLGVSGDLIFLPFQRLNRSGAFTKWNVKKDRTYTMDLKEDEAQKAWAHVAAVASGFIGV